MTILCIPGYLLVLQDNLIFAYSSGGRLQQIGFILLFKIIIIVVVVNIFGVVFQRSWKMLQTVPFAVTNYQNQIDPEKGRGGRIGTC